MPRCISDRALRAERYEVPAALGEIPFDVQLTIPELGWRSCGLFYKDLAPPQGLMMVGLWAPVNAYRNPCHWKREGRFNPPIADSVDALVFAMQVQELTEAGKPTEVVIDGFPGKYLRLEVPADLDTSGCDVGEFRFWDGPGDSVWWVGALDAPGLIGEVWVLDVDGQRVVVQAASYVDAEERYRDEIHAIVESIDFLTDGAP